jgi:exodeoxyribonuclease V
MFEDVQQEAPKWMLNNGQQTAFDWLVAWALGTDHKDWPWVCLGGIAGAGKTFLLNRVIEAVRKQQSGMAVGMTAPTHKAVRVLKKHSELRFQLDFGTIHSFLALTPKINQKDGTVSYEPEFMGRRKIDDIDILVVDESSMLDDKLFAFIEQECINTQLKIIFMGDPLQIPPVDKKKRESQAYAIPFMDAIRIQKKMHYLELVEPQRQAANSPILMYAHNIRKHIKDQHIPWTFTEEDKHALELIPPFGNMPRLKSLFLQYFDTPEFEADADYCKVVAWQNKTVDYFNREIRLLINKAETLPRIIVGDRLIMDAHYLVDKKIVLPNNEEIKVVSCEVEEKTIKYHYISPVALLQSMTGNIETETKTLTCRVYKVALVNDDGRVMHTHILHEDSIEEYEAVRKSLEEAARKTADVYHRKKMWSEFYKIAEGFAWVKHNYAITAHKAQGSTYTYCFSMEWDILLNHSISERNSIAYVAATRASTKLFVIKPA